MEFVEALAAGRDGSQLVVEYTHERSGWVALPPTLCSRLFETRAATPLALELRQIHRRAGVALPADKPLYAAWAGATCAAGFVGVPGGLGRALGLAEGATVAVHPLPDTPSAVSVTVEPASEDDWEVVQLNAAYLEEQLLNQVGVASPQQPLPFWMRSVGVTLRVTSMVPPVPVVRLVRGSEIYVAPRPRVRAAGTAAAAGGNLLPSAAGGTAQQQQQQGGSGSGGGSGMTAAHRQQQQEGTGDGKGEEQEGEDASAVPLQAVLRVQQVSSAVVLSSLSADSAAAAADNRCSQPPPPSQQELPPGLQLVGASPAALARCGLCPGDWVRLAGRDSRSLVKFACLVPLAAAAPGHLALTAEQCVWAAAPPCSHIRLQRLTPGQRQLIWEAAELQRANGGAATTGSSRTTLRGMLGRVATPAASAGGASQQEAGATALAELGWLRPAAEAALQHLLPVLGFTPRSLLQSWGAPRPGGLLVCGPAGSGKSALLAAAAAALRRHPECLTHCVTVSCREISAEGASQAQAQLVPKVREALEHLPALLVFDDLDVLCPAESAGADGAATSADASLVTWLCDLLDWLASPSPEDWGRLAPAMGGAPDAAGNVGGSSGGSNGPALWPPLAVAATCKDAATLAAPLRAAGRLDHTVSLPAATVESRAAMLASAAAARGAHMEAHHLRLVAEKAEGFDAADLAVLLDRALHIAVRRQLAASASEQPTGGGLQLAAAQGARGPNASGGAAGGLPAAAVVAAEQQQPLLRLVQGDLEAALEGFTPAAFWGTGSHRGMQAGVEGWADVGGMEEARQALHEALELPTRYARLVAKAPLRLRTGVLLYGPPGCGKTHIVAAAVAAAGVRCITVSGPELLNKYIGASEAAVRDVFRRAAAAAPCVLFFDEFDAIAPQRGHDNTGVTDRVVNQLLTELDGVEGLRGVCVVAATSRPDLIDAALLRPGRLDRLVFCGFPSPLERGQVLRALGRGIRLAPDVDLDLVGYNAEFYSGADLAALLAEAQLAAVHEALEGGGEGAAEAAAAAAAGPPAPPEPPVIQRRHLEAALLAARPSVPEGERERLEAVYSHFRQDREPAGSAGDKGKGKLVSWA